MLHSEPVGSGSLTLGRVLLACKALNFDSYTVKNLYPAAIPNTNAFPKVKDDPIWGKGRTQILNSLNDETTGAVLLGFGVSPPSGLQRGNYLDRVSWLTDELRRRSLVVWTFGGRTSHPSRWHREVRRSDPGKSVEESVHRFLTRFES